MLAKKQDLVEQRPSAQELAAAVGSVGGQNLQSDLERLCEMTL